MTQTGRGAVEPALLITPGVVALAAAFALPVAQVIAYAFFTDGAPSWNGIDLSSWTRLFADDYHLLVGLRTLRLGLIVTALCLTLGYPLALVIVNASSRMKALLILALILPLMTSVVVRTFGWLVLLGRGGPIAKFLREQGWVANNFQLAYTETGVVIAMTQVLLPYMVLVLVGSLGQIDPKLLEAARTMGATWRDSLARIVWPLSRPGAIAGSILVFAVTISSFITPSVVGGLKLPVLASGVYHSAISYSDWPLAAAQATALFVILIALLLPYSLARRAVSR